MNIDTESVGILLGMWNGKVGYGCAQDKFMTDGCVEQVFLFMVIPGIGVKTSSIL